jgi:peroxiredoxin
MQTIKSGQHRRCAHSACYPDLKVIRSYGVLQHYVNEPSRLTARRAFFLIDQEGIVRGRWLPEKQAGPFPNDPILARVREITGQR